ncbi:MULTISPECIES: phage baseplate assembly protein V [unclassified Pseudomonas]|uniref:phage baseplate assembly protein V n=1 Tax=unclassified Pseudomonas TaxID=196821 RepID=UPI002AC93E68|nr:MULTISPECIES: phage baseplate assembly protein V [unclassified Pseudomonas]MEB0044684.1 phage baseplate assembly protein V [Pseudomonas sp. Dout3]MEB0096349.1 phage baseplate assembly protein V [Pseudomonas sp. DC1.2]WPX59254.1 phage baseplate assembly protein V [Pseudomonas sp. DC1.2]
MEDAIRRAVERQFPELTGGYHLPRFARVVAVADAPAGAGICDDFRPRYAVDIELLGPDGEVDPQLPLLAGVPLPLPTGGEEMGMYAFPEEGTQVVVCFAYGLPNKPYIQTILPHGLSMPRVPKGDQVWQHSEAAQQRVDADGNWLRQTDGKITDKAIEREVEALDNREQFQSHSQAVDDHSTETVGGIKTIEALGALKLMSGGSASLAAVDDLHQATGRDLNLVVGQKHNATVGGDMQERIEGLRKSLAGGSQRFEAPKTWIGSSGVNVLQVLCDLLDLVNQMNTQLAGHKHGPTPPPDTAGEFTGNAASALLLSGKLKPITG